MLPFSFVKKLTKKLTHKASRLLAIFFPVFVLRISLLGRFFYRSNNNHYFLG